MKPNNLIRVSLIVCIVLLCTGFAVYSFMRLDTVEERRNFDLFTLIPQDVEAVFETDCAAELVEDIDNMVCSRNGHFLYASDLFSSVKKYLRAFMEEEPHGLRWEMNELVVSFHNPDLQNDQVLYCRMGTGDRTLLENHLRRSGSATFPSRTSSYRGQTIEVYPLVDGRFLAVWMKRDFLVVSFQKRLVEQVIDAWKQKKTLAQLDTFHFTNEKKREENNTTVYVRWPVRTASQFATDASLWLEFNLKFAEEGVYCAGIVHGSDTLGIPLRDALFDSYPLEGFLGDKLPASTFLYKVATLSASKAEVGCALKQLQTDSAMVVAANGSFDASLASYFQLEAGSQMLSCGFLSNDSAARKPLTVLNISVKDVAHAQWELQKLLYSVSQGRYPFYKSFSAATGVSGLRLYRLPDHRLTALLAGYTGGPAFTYACFYKHSLLLSPDEQSLAAYVISLERGDVLESQLFYEIATEKLAPDYQALVMADMSEVVLHPDLSRDLLPPFFLAHADFFRHFLLSIQLCCVENVIYPNLVLLYAYPDVPAE